MKESRITKMADYITEHTNVSIKDLSNIFDVSIYTVRRDIDELAERGILSKYYGGVKINKEDNYLVDFEERHPVHRDEKRKIAKRAASFINPGDVIFIDGGTTTLYIPNYLSDINITVITNSIFIVTKLLPKKNINIVILGGEVNRSTNSVTGIDTIEFLKTINISKSFLSCTGISDNFNLTNHTFVDAELKKLCLKNSAKSYLLADNTKFGVSSLVTYGKISELTALITNATVPEIFVTQCQQNDVSLFLE